MDPDNNKKQVIKDHVINFKTKVKNYYTVKKNPSIKQDKFIFQLMWLTPAVVLLAIFMFYAIFIMVRNSTNGGPDYKYQFSWENFKTTATNTEFKIALKNSLIFSAVVVPSSLIISLLIAKSLASVLSHRIFSFLQGLFFLPYVTSAMAIAMSFAFIFSPAGIMNKMLDLVGLQKIPWLTDGKYAIWTLLIYGLWRALPFNIVMLTTALMKLNRQYYQAASIDGVPFWKQFWKITLPGIVPMLAYLAIVGLIASFKVFPLGLYATYTDAARFHAQTVVFWIFDRINSGKFNQAAAAAIILMAIVLAITIITRRISMFLNRRYGAY